MSDIFISYKREDQPVARRLADALEKEGWTVWWDPKLRADEHFDDVIEAALKESRCVVVLWSKGSVQSRYVHDEAVYAIEHNKFFPVVIDNVELPFRFRGFQTLDLKNWDGSSASIEFHRFVADIAFQLANPPKHDTVDEHLSEDKQEEPYKEQSSTLRDGEKTTPPTEEIENQSPSQNLSVTPHELQNNGWLPGDI